MAEVALTFALSGQVIHVGAAVRSAYRSADEGEAPSGATHVLTLYALRDSLLKWASINTKPCPKCSV